MPKSNPLRAADAASLPEVVTQALATAEIDFSVHHSDAVDPQLRLYVSLVQQHAKQLMVVIPRSHILSLTKLDSETQTQWQATPTTTVKQLLDQYRLESLPALPQLFKLTCLCDPAVFMQSEVYFDSGVTGLLIGLQPSALLRLFSTSQRVNCAEAIRNQHPNSSAMENDEQGIKDAVARFTSRRIYQRLEDTLEIPVLNSTAKKVLQLRNDPLADVDELAAIVETDPPLAAQVISWAASPYYASPTKIRSVEDAILRILGFELVLNLALALSLKKSLELPNVQPRNSTPYWQQAIYTAALIEGLARAMPAEQKPESGLAYLGGLLHNFGFVLLAHVFPPHYALVCNALEANTHLSHSVIEHHLLGTTREKMGAWLMQCWNIPEEVITALRFQDDPKYQDKHASYANLNCLAQNLLAQRGIGSSQHSTMPDCLYQGLGIDEQTAQQVLHNLLEAEQALSHLTQQFTQY